MKSMSSVINNVVEDDIEMTTLLADSESTKIKGHIKQPQYSYISFKCFALISTCAFVAGFMLSSNVITANNQNEDGVYVPLLIDYDSNNIEGAPPQQQDGLKEIKVTPLFNESFTQLLTTGMQEILNRNKRNKNSNSTKHHYYPLQSPYELRFPCEKQPYWARRTIPFNTNIKNDKQICFVHIGKAGGSTLGCLLGFSLHCDNDNDIKGLLPIVTTHVLHRGVHDCTDDAAYYLFVVRDPLSRILSDYNYERVNVTSDKPLGKEGYHEDELYLNCSFSTLNELAEYGLLYHGDDEEKKKCRQSAFEAVSGNGWRKYLAHGYYNYQYYTQLIYNTEDRLDGPSIPDDNPNLLVIRNTNMVNDWNKINIMLGGEPEVLRAEDIPVNNAHAKNETELYLSPRSKEVLCNVLCNEIQVYKEIINKALNLDEEEIQEAIDNLAESCPQQAMHSTCRLPRPNFQHKISKVRGETPIVGMELGVPPKKTNK